MNGWGTPYDVAATLGRPERTIRTWAQRRLIRTRRDPDNGALLVWWPDCFDLSRTATRRTRRSAAA